MLLHVFSYSHLQWLQCIKKYEAWKGQCVKRVSSKILGYSYNALWIHRLEKLA